jgi:hypothetical protein
VGTGAQEAMRRLRSRQAKERRSGTVRRVGRKRMSRIVN